MLLTIAAASTSPLPMALIKEHLNIRASATAWNGTLECYREAAVEAVERETTRILAPTTYEYRLTPERCGWPCEISLPVAPVRDVREVRYLDQAGDLQTLDAGDWVWDRTASGATIRAASGVTLPALASGREGQVRVLFDAGYDAPEGGTGTGSDAELILPKAARTLLLMLVGLWWEHKTPVVGPEAQYTIPHGVQWLLDKLRIYR